MSITRLDGLRTLIGFLVAVIALVLGLALLEAGQRGAAYGAFSAGVVGVFFALAGKSSVGALSGGGGTKGAWAALTTSAKPEGTEPPAPPPAAGFATLRALLWLLLAGCVLGSCASCGQALISSMAGVGTGPEPSAALTLAAFAGMILFPVGVILAAVHLGQPKPPPPPPGA